MTNREKFLIGKPFKVTEKSPVRTFEILVKMFIKRDDQIEYEVVLIEKTFFMYQNFSGKGVNRQDFNDLIFVEDDK